MVVACGALLHDVGMAIHREDHEAYGLFLAERKLRELLADVYRDPAERTVVIAESLHAIIGHRRRGEPYTVEGGVVRVADALDMAEGRSRVPIEAGKKMDEMLVSGELAAAIGVDVKSQDVKPLIPNGQDAGLAALKSRGHYPINHTVVVKDELLETRPGLAGDVFDAFAQAKRLYVEKLRSGAIAKPTAPHATSARRGSGTDGSASGRIRTGTSGTRWRGPWL